MRLQVQALTHHDRQLAGMARGVRAAVVVPLLFALGLFVIKQPQMAGFGLRNVRAPGDGELRSSENNQGLPRLPR